MNQHFTEEDIIGGVKKLNGGKPVCVDMMDEAMRAPTLDEAVKVVMMDTEYWDGPSYNTINS